MVNIVKGAITLLLSVGIAFSAVCMRVVILHGGKKPVLPTRVLFYKVLLKTHLLDNLQVKCLQKNLKA